MSKAFSNEYTLNINIKTASKVLSKYRTPKRVRFEEKFVIWKEIIKENQFLSVSKVARNQPCVCRAHCRG